MKKILLITLLISLLLLVSCSDEPALPLEGPVINDPLTDTTEADSVACYYSLKTEDGFENYILAFPPEWRAGYQGVLEYDDETFATAIHNATETIHSIRDEEYGYSTYNIEYEFVEEREITGSEYQNLTKELADYCYMTRSSITEMKESTYSVHTYGLTELGEVVNEATELEKLYLVFIEGDGWYVSPHNFDLP